MHEDTPDHANRLDLLQCWLALEIDYCARTAREEHARAKRLRQDISPGLAGYCDGRADSHERFARRLQSLIDDLKDAVTC
jgi:hypothetical protein